MAMNPMQRKARNAFLLGLITALIIGGIVIAVLFMRIKSLNQKVVQTQQEAQIAMKTVYVMSEDAEKNEFLIPKIKTQQVPAQLVPDNAITSENIEYYYLKVDEEPIDLDVDINNADVNETLKKEYEDFLEGVDGDEERTDYAIMKSRIPLSAGTMLTTDMVVRSDIASTYRNMEYTMITLPSLLEEGDYIDVRIAYPDGTDFVILSKKQVKKCNTTTIWLDVSESEMLSLGEAIVEYYVMDGNAKLYATRYMNVAQSDVSVTYVPNENIAALIEHNATLTEKEILKSLQDDGTVQSVRSFIDTSLSSVERDKAMDSVKEGYEAERAGIQAIRAEMLGDMGY